MGKDASPPPAPSPQATAAAQTDSNIATANANATLNRTNQVTPFGNLTYTPGTPDANGTSQWTANYNLSPQQQQLLDAQTGQSLNLANLANQQLGTVNSTLGTPLSFSGAPAINNQTVGTGGPLQTSIASGGPIQNSINTALNGWSTGSGGPIQNSLKVTGDQLSNDLNTTRDSLYNQQTAYLDPQWQNQQSALQNSLANQGVQQNSEAWNKAMDDFQRQKEFAYGQARQSAITGGGAEQSRLQQMDLNAGNFANSAEAQGYNQSANNAAMTNQGLTQAFNQLMAGANFSNAAQQQGFGENATNAAFGNAAQGQAFNQNAQASQQNFNQSSALRSQFLNELMTQRSNPLNELNALRSGSQMTNPTFGSTPQSSVNPTDVAGITNAATAQGNNVYNTQVGASNSTTAALGSLASMAAMFFMSDERLKENIDKVGELNDGTNIYKFNYLGDLRPQVGVMAQEVEKKDPEAVKIHQSGFKMVDYARVLKNANR